VSLDARSAELVHALEAVTPIDATERADVASTIELVVSTDAPFAEHAQADHVTASTFAVSTGGVLLHRHRRLGLWLQPGGHVDGDERPTDAALRELTEETGVVAVHLDPPCLVHVAVHDTPWGHRHFDCRWLVRATSTVLAPAAGESDAVQWLLPAAALARCEPSLVVGLGKALDVARRDRLAEVASWPP
jgi:8-oxo-dGTP pyrophosphatase MutT (NUDIX family)